MATRQEQNLQRATDHARQAAALQRAAETLLQMNHTHAAHLLACHAGITANDAITINKTGETHAGDHRRAADTLLEADRTLTDLAEIVRTLAEEKNTVAYKIVTRNVPRQERAVRDGTVERWSKQRVRR